jgi:ElaB/YqjD/DUF883 family membrane-anchored ribosome-binding protein
MENVAPEMLRNQVDELKEACQEERQSALHLARAAVDTSKAAVGFADNWVRYNAWKLLGITLALGLAVGFLVRRRSREADSEAVPR